ncbi:MAG TPA: NAD(+) diphosphatase [Solirubrobacteraceae bacterium]
MPSSDPDGRPFTGAQLDRASTERKDSQLVEQLHEDPAARAIPAGRDGVLVTSNGAGALLRSPVDAANHQEPILLGLDERGAGLFALDLDALPVASREELAAGAKLVSLREAGTSLPHEEAGLAAYVTALLNWHRHHRFCANCGAATEMEEAGYARRCPVCGTHHFPRTDPVVIMTVSHGDRLLLGRRAGWPFPRFSVLAGFVAAGESAEEAVVREVQEESGIVARAPAFVSSQPWPFPSSLMLGFDAVADGGEPRASDDELEEVHWFNLDDVRAATREQNSDLRLPPPVSIARFLVERWVERRDRDVRY